jgi:molybdate transport system ATP-binding protein
MTLQVQLRHGFPGFKLDMSFKAGAGVTALFGRSGAGKTTVINAVAGLLRPDEGYIRIGDDVLMDTARGICVPAHERRLGYVFQDARLFPHLPVRNNLMFGARYAPAHAPGPTLETVFDLLGLETLLDRAPNTLSGGEKQRVALGRALLSKPRLLLMDEPLASLDAPRKAEILPYLERLRDGPLSLPILYVSHARSEVERLADALVLIEEGQVTAQGPLDQVRLREAAVPFFGPAEPIALIDATVEEAQTLRTSFGLVPLPDLKADVGTKLKLRLSASDVILSMQDPGPVSSGVVIATRTIGVLGVEDGYIYVSLEAGKDQLWTRTTEETFEEMKLVPDTPCFAILRVTAPT